MANFNFLMMLWGLFIIHRADYKVDNTTTAPKDSYQIENSFVFTGDKILLSEVAVDNEFIEIYNPNNHAVDLSDMYLTDATFAPLTQFYYKITDGSIPGGGSFRDFHAKFPVGSRICCPLVSVSLQR